MSPPFIGLSGKQKYWITLVTNLHIISTLKVSQFWKNVYKSGAIQTWYNTFKCFLIKLTTESRSARGASRHSAFMDGSLTVSKRVGPVHLVERWGCRSWTMVMAINKLFNFLLIRGDSMVDISPGSHRWSPGSILPRRQKTILSYCHGNGLDKWWGRLWGSV